MKEIKLDFVVRRKEDSKVYIRAEEAGLKTDCFEKKSDKIKKEITVKITNNSGRDFVGVIHIKVKCDTDEPKFFMPGYIYGRNTADMPSSGRKPFPRIKEGAEQMPESEFFMTRSDRLAEPVGIMYDGGRVVGISAAPVINGKFCGFSCNINDEGKSSVGYTLGYENAPWLFVQTATVKERKTLEEENSFSLSDGEEFSFDVTVYDYCGEDERAIYKALEDTYFRFHESPRKIEGMDAKKAVGLLSTAIRDFAWIEEDKAYTGFVFDKPEGLSYNKIPSVSWTNGLAVAVPMLLAADTLGDEKARKQSIAFIEETIEKSFNDKSGFLYESMNNGIPTVRGWWYDGMHSGGHSSYLNGQAVYYIVKAYLCEKENNREEHSEWLEFAGKIVAKMNTVLNTDYEYPFSMSEDTGTGLEYDSMGGAWFLAATAMYELASGDRKYMDVLRKSEEHYFYKFVKKVECYGAPLDTDKAVDSEGVLSFIRAARILHEMTGEEVFLDRLRDALFYEFTFKLGYNTPVKVRPLSEIGWSSAGGSITSVANPHIHPMSSTVIDEMRYYLSFRKDKYVAERLSDTIGWSLQTFNTKEKEYGYGKVGWMSERYCFCEGLLTEHYPDGEVASTWFALMPWASASIIEGLVGLIR